MTTRLYDRQDNIAQTNTKIKKTNKRSTALERSIRKLLEGLNQPHPNPILYCLTGALVSLRDLFVNTSFFLIFLTHTKKYVHQDEHLQCCQVQSRDKGALAWYGQLTWESAHAWILIILCYLIVWGITLKFMARLSFYATPLLIYDVMNDITITLRVPSYNHF